MTLYLISVLIVCNIGYHNTSSDDQADKICCECWKKLLNKVNNGTVCTSPERSGLVSEVLDWGSPFEGLLV